MGDARPRRKILVGDVVSDRMEKTVVVEVIHHLRHPLYNKMIRRRHRFKAHDEEKRCRVGDRVSLMETRPLSRDKRWRVVEILRRAAE